MYESVVGARLHVAEHGEHAAWLQAESSTRSSIVSRQLGSVVILLSQLNLLRNLRELSIIYPSLQVAGSALECRSLAIPNMLSGRTVCSW